MTSHAKRVLSTIIAVAVVAGWLIGVLADGPAAMINLAKHGPMILQHPNFWWSVAAALTMAISMWFIWRPSAATLIIAAETRPVVVPSDQIIEFIESQIERIEKEISNESATKPTGTMLFDSDVVLAYDDNIKQIVDRFVLHTIPAFLEGRLGKKERERFDRVVEIAKSKSSSDDLAAYHAAVAYLSAFCSLRSERIAIEKSEKVDSPEIKLQPKKQTAAEQNVAIHPPFRSARDTPSSPSESAS